jgi:uncharacterized membrane protein
MTGEEKTAWVYGIVVILTSGTYFAWLAIQLASHPVEEIAWEVPLLVTIGASILGVIVLTIVSAIGGAVWSGIRGRFQEPDFTKDERDRDISRLADRRNYAVISIGLFGTLVLAMLDVDTLWIGNWVFLAGTVGALIEVGTKVRAYRRGF